MVFFLYGQDTYRVLLRAREIVVDDRKTRGVSSRVFRWDGEVDSKDDLLREARSCSLFGGQTLFILENIFSSKEATSIVASLLDHLGTVVIICRGNPPRSSATTSLLSLASCYAYPLLEGKALREHIVQEFKGHGVDPNSELVELLAKTLASDPWSMAQEIKKVSLALKAGVKDWKLLLSLPALTNVFETVEAIARKDLSGALSRVAQHIQKGDDPLYLLAMIVFQYRLLLEVQNQEKGGKLAFPQRKALSISSTLSRQEIKDSYKNIWETEVQIKTGKKDPVEGLFSLLFALSS
ncbi:MAG: hypothetical protein Q8P70_01790 [bacterium]|nr:hypothetical protein [bacterium]